jgi:hypothetical protein
VPLSTDLSISPSLVVFAAFFLLGPFFGSVVVVAGVAADGVVVAGAAAGTPGIVSVLVVEVFWANTTPTGKITNITAATAAAIRESIFMRNSNIS